MPSGTVIVADVHAEILGVAQDDDALYYSDFAGDIVSTASGLHRVAKSGGTSPQTLAVVDNLDFIAVDDSFLYFAEPGGSIDRVPKQGGAVEVVTFGGAMPAEIAVDTNALYWADSIDLDAGDSSVAAGVWTMPKAGGTPVLAAPAGPTRFIASDGTGAIAWDDDDGVFWSRGAGAAITELQAGYANHFAPVMAGGGVFWSPESGAGTIPTFCAWFPGSEQGDAQAGRFLTVPFVPSAAYGTGTQLDASAVEAFTADGQSMYWAYDGAIFRASVASGLIEQVTSSTPKETSPDCLVQESAVTELLVDARSVYSFEFWQDCTGLHGDIRAIAK